MNPLAKMFEPSKDRLIGNAKRMMDNAQDPWFKQLSLIHISEPTRRNAISYAVFC